MKVSLSVARGGQPRTSTITPDVTPVGWRARRRARRRLAEQDYLGARLAELTQIRELVAAAREVVGAGWVKDAWFVSHDAQGKPRSVDFMAARRMGNIPVDRACLVGAILHAGGGVASADTQLVQRTFDLTWHTIHRGPQEPVRWCPAPPIRAQQLRDLVQWNDRADRTGTDVEALLHSVEQAAVREVDSEPPHARRLHRPGIAPRRFGSLRCLRSSGHVFVGFLRRVAAEPRSGGGHRGQGLSLAERRLPRSGRRGRVVDHWREWDKSDICYTLSTCRAHCSVPRRLLTAPRERHGASPGLSSRFARRAC